LQKIDESLLDKNREKLVLWQIQQRQRKIEGIRLHLGSGEINFLDYVNIDMYSSKANLKADIRNLPFKKESISEIVSYSTIEHLPMRTVYKTLQHWFDLLISGIGTIELSIPDFELSCQLFLEASEEKKWNRFVWQIFGGQTNADVLNTKKEWDMCDEFPYAEEQVHKCGLSMGHLVRMLEEIGYRMNECYWYWWYGIPMLFIYAFKPNKNPVYKSILEKDVALGVFTNKCDFLPMLWKSANKFLPQIPFLTRIQRNGINEGMRLLKQDFVKTKKRFVIYLDDDIQFINEDIIKNALEYLISGKHACVSVYSDFDENCLITPYNPKERGLISRPHRWATGYFICVDMARIGDVEPDMGLPWPNQSCDTSFSCEILSRGWSIGISADYVSHLKKNTIYYSNVINDTNNYLLNKWGSFYFENIIYDYNVDSLGWRRDDWGKQ
jgi:hypothetical protein